MRFLKWLTLATFAVLPAMTLWKDVAAQNQVAAKKDVPAGDGPVVYKGARIHTASGPVIEQGRADRAQGQDPRRRRARTRSRSRPGAQVRDMTGKVIIPGLVDTHSHIGIFARTRRRATATR